MSHKQITFIKTFKHFEKLELDLDSPTLKQAMVNLGISKSEINKRYVLFAYICKSLGQRVTSKIQLLMIK